jgi:thymidylate kinase
VSQVKMRNLKPRFVAQAVGSPITIVTDPHGKPPRGALFSLAKMAAWLCEEWYAYMFFERDTLLVCDRYFHDLLVDPRRYRFGAWLWTARLAGRLMPQPKLWILLDAPADVLQARKQEVEPQETARQCAAYRVFVSGTRCHAIVDASRPLEAVIEDASRAIAGVVGYQAADA